MMEITIKQKEIKITDMKKRLRSHGANWQILTSNAVVPGYIIKWTELMVTEEKEGSPQKRQHNYKGPYTISQLG